MNALRLYFRYSLSSTLSYWIIFISIGIKIFKMVLSHFKNTNGIKYKTKKI
jgi:hypothetical protein